MPDRRPACDCCGPNTFDDKLAKDDLERYRKQGPDPTTKTLLDAIKAQGIDGATVLDIGGGIGAIQLELLAAGAASVVAVDASEAYVGVARAEAERRGYADRTSAHVGDFTELASDIPSADIVTLDRVVCCDPDLQALLGTAASHARRMVGLVYPRVTWWNRVGARGIAFWGWITRDPTRWHLHPVPDIDRALWQAGFEKHELARTFIWEVALYLRPRGTAVS